MKWISTSTCALVALIGWGCEVTPIEAPPEDARDTGSPADDGPTGEPDTHDAGFTFCDPEAEESGCPDGQRCETRAHVCVDCVGFRQRCTEGGRETCEAPVSAGIGLIERGGFFEEDACAPAEACVPDGTRAECAPVICDPGYGSCADASTAERCSADGTEQIVETCDPGRACYEGRCEFLRHNVVLVFDTSGSMHDYIDPSVPGSPIQCDQNDTPCLDPWPICDDPSSPLTLMTQSKVVFADSIASALGGFSQFALARFPQRAAATNTANCLLGWYLPTGRITGDDDAWATEEGGWFDAHMHEAIVVPFPVRNTLSNRDALLEWVDFEERLRATETPCEGHADCEIGACGTVNGEGRCYQHANHELRAGGETPLGKSLFYAGEYLRRKVRVDGKPCSVDANCGSAGYVCREDRCVDPYRHCRDDFIILFTDGEETEHPLTTQFFNPRVQAQRLAFGLACEEDADCRGGATCETFTHGCSGQRLGAEPSRCLGPEQEVCDVPLDVNVDAPHRALASPDGQTISARTTVITLAEGGGASVGTKNAAIAAAGGGVHLDVSAQDPEGFQETLVQAMSPNFKCEPEDL